MRSVNTVRIVWLLLATFLLGACAADADPSQLLPAAPHEKVTNASSALGTCSQGSLVASLPSPQQPGPTVVLTGSGTSCTTPLYQFWMLDHSGPNDWQMVQDFSPNASFVWNTSVALDGNYDFQVWLRDSTSNSTYDTYGAIGFMLEQRPGGVCTGATASASLPTPQSPGPTITLTGTSASCSTPLYQFVMLDRSGPNDWVVVQAYSPSPTFAWDTSSAADGTYYVQIWVKDSSSNAPYDTYGTLGYTLQAGEDGVCGYVTVRART